MSIVHQAVDSILCQRHKVFVGRQEGKDAELRKKTRQCDKRKKREKQDVDWQEWSIEGYRIEDLAYHVYLPMQRATRPMAHYSFDSMQK